MILLHPLLKNPSHPEPPAISPSGTRPVPVDGSGEVQSSQGYPSSDGGSKRPRTAPPPAVFASANDGWQYTGPLAEKLPQPRVAVINLWAVPGATINVYNPMVLVDGRPKLITSATAPHASTGPRNAGAPATSSSFSSEWTRFQAAGVPGMVTVALPIPKEADWHINDVIQVTQTVGERRESLPATTEFIAYRSGLPANGHLPYAKAGQISREGFTITGSGDYAVPPRAELQLLADGLPAGPAIRAGDDGRFKLEIPFATHGALELRVANAGGITKLPITGTPEPWNQRIARWERGLREGLLRTPIDGRIEVALDGLPAGYRIEVTNPSVAREPHVFTADEQGHLVIKLSDVAAEDVLAINGAPMKVADPNGSVRNYELDALYQLPNHAEEERFEHVFRALHHLPEREMKFALELFGPYSPVADLREIRDPHAMKRVLEGAKLGTVIRSFGFAEQVKTHLGQLSDSSFRQGFLQGLKYQGDYRATYAEVGLEMVRAGGSRMVITGGYSPISGSHGPLRPETVKNPDTYRLSVEGLSPLTLTTGGYGPSGWVNPSAILLSFTRSGTSSSWKEG